MNDPSIMTIFDLLCNPFRMILICFLSFCNACINIKLDVGKTTDYETGNITENVIMTYKYHLSIHNETKYN